MAVLTSEEHQTQLAFIDTPGVIETPSYQLQSTMMEAVKGSLNTADVILVLTDVFSTVPLSPDDAVLTKLQVMLVSPNPSPSRPHPPPPYTTPPHPSLTKCRKLLRRS